MSFRVIVAASLMVAAIMAIAVLFWRLDSGGEQAETTNHGEYPVSRRVHWEYSVRNSTNLSLHNVEIFSFLPLPKTWQQSLDGVVGNHPVEMRQAKSGRAIGRIDVATIPPYGQRMLRLTAELSMAAGFDNPESSPSEDYLSSEPMIESDHEDIRQLAQTLLRDDTLETAEAIYDWLVTEIAYSGFDPVDRGALYALIHGRGDCSEYGALAVALARAIGLPARLVSGYVMPDDGRLEVHAFHSWAEIRVDNRWLIIDAQDRIFDPRPTHYLATHYGIQSSPSNPWTRFYSPETAVVIEMR
jgi:hypothetical protein